MRAGGDVLSEEEKSHPSLPVGSSAQPWLEQGAADQASRLGRTSTITGPSAPLAEASATANASEPGWMPFPPKALQGWLSVQPESMRWRAAPLPASDVVRWRVAVR